MDPIKELLVQTMLILQHYQLFHTFTWTISER
jgi:hypothetical protein